MFIPWLLFEPLAFLFWGWFRTLMVYTLYGVVAGAILRVFMGVGMGYVTTYAGALMGTGSSDPAELGLWVVVLLPLVVSGLMAGLKVGELAAMLVSGSGSVGSGMMALVVRGGGRLAAASPTRPAPQSPEAEGDVHEPRHATLAASTRKSGARPSQANRKLRTLAMILGGACLALAVLLLRVATVEPPRPIVVRVDEVGRAEAVAYEAATAQADPLDPTTKYFLNRFIADFYSRRRATVEEHWTRSLRFLSTELANATFTRDGAEVAAMAAGTTDTERQVEQVVLRIHPAPEAPHGATADFDLVHLRDGQETLRESGGRSRSGSRSSLHHPLRARRLQPDGHPSSPTSRPTVPWSRRSPAMIAHLRGREAALEALRVDRDARPSGSRWRVSTAECSSAPNGPGSSTRIPNRRCAASTP